MIRRFKQWRERCQYLKAIRNAMAALKIIYPHASCRYKSLLALAVWDFIAEYGERFNQKRTAQFYFDELNRIVNTSLKEE